jgi:hypothetical protein
MGSGVERHESDSCTTINISRFYEYETLGGSSSTTLGYCGTRLGESPALQWTGSSFTQRASRNKNGLQQSA